MKRRNIVRLVSFLCAIIVILAGVIVKNSHTAQSLELQIENGYSRNLNEFSASMNNISLLLKKVRYAKEPTLLSSLSAELLTEAEISKSALSSLPLSRGLDALNLFLSQAGNYAFAVSQMLYSGKTAPSDFSENIRAISEAAEKISSIVSDAQINFDNNDYWIKEIERKLEVHIENTLNGSLGKIENELGDYPTLVYDGPYSDSIINKEPEMLKNTDYITKQQAESKAYKFMEEREKLASFSEINGKIEAYRFGNDNTDIAVSKRGGYIVFMRRYRDIQKTVLSYGQALSKAKRFLESCSRDKFIETYYFIDEGVCVINFAYLDGETICYTDLIKVGIAMDTGEVMLYEASGYLSNHKSRAFESAIFLPEQAEEKVSRDLKINKISKVLIPTNSGEKRCYEFSCSDGETNVLVYINLLNLDEEEILILLKNDGGTLAK